MNLPRWHAFAKRTQLLMIGSELMRARVWQVGDAEKFESALHRAIELIDCTASDPKWQDSLAALSILKQEIELFIGGKRKDDVFALYIAL